MGGVVHGKGTVFKIKDAGTTIRDLSSFHTEVNFPLKAQALDVTTFGKNSNVYKVGLKNGQFSLKGWFDSTATSGPDVVLSGLLGFQHAAGANLTGAPNFQYGPEGSASGKVRYWGDFVMTDYQTTAPVANIVNFSATFQCSDDVTRDTANFV